MPGELSMAATSAGRAAGSAGGDALASPVWAALVSASSADMGVTPCSSVAMATSSGEVPCGATTSSPWILTRLGCGLFPNVGYCFFVLPSLHPEAGRRNYSVRSARGRSGGPPPSRGLRNQMIRDKCMGLLPSLSPDPPRRTPRTVHGPGRVPPQCTIHAYVLRLGIYI